MTRKLENTFASRRFARARSSPRGRRVLARDDDRKSAMTLESAKIANLAGDEKITLFAHTPLNSKRNLKSHVES